MVHLHCPTQRPRQTPIKCIYNQWKCVSVWVYAHFNHHRFYRYRNQSRPVETPLPSDEFNHTTIYYLECFRCCRSRRRQRPTAAAAVDTRDARGRRRSAQASTRSYPARSRPETRNPGGEFAIRPASHCGSSFAMTSAII